MLLGWVVRYKNTYLSICCTKQGVISEQLGAEDYVIYSRMFVIAVFVIAVFVIAVLVIAVFVMAVLLIVVLVIAAFYSTGTRAYFLNCTNTVFRA